MIRAAFIAAMSIALSATFEYAFSDPMETETEEIIVSVDEDKTKEIEYGFDQAGTRMGTADTLISNVRVFLQLPKGFKLEAPSQLELRVFDRRNKQVLTETFDLVTIPNDRGSYPNIIEQAEYSVIAHEISSSNRAKARDFDKSVKSMRDEAPGRNKLGLFFRMDTCVTAGSVVPETFSTPIFLQFNTEDPLIKPYRKIGQ
ncbi:MAG: hypothetical protein AAGK66_10990 [Pseudomonadota bacterium]